MGTRTLPGAAVLAFGLLIAGCNSSRSSRDTAIDPSTGHDAPQDVEAVDVPDEATARRSAPLNLPAEYRPEYHPTTRDYIHEIEGALKPLETISSRAAADASANADGSPGSVVDGSPLTATRW